jgi:hypothetical protein
VHIISTLVFPACWPQCCSSLLPEGFAQTAREEESFVCLIQCRLSAQGVGVIFQFALRLRIETNHVVWFLHELERWRTWGLIRIVWDKA